MTTVEKLLVQLCERKHSIIDLVKQQTELYSQHLACEFLIDGIAPPSWLWDTNTASSEELSKEDLISKILCPYPRPSVGCSVARYPGFINLVNTEDNEEFSDGGFVENPAFQRDLDGKNELTVPGFSGQDHGGCGLNQMPDLDASASSPVDHTNGRILGIYTAPDQSLAEFQRSKSRQKALELRSSAKALAKSGLRHEGISDIASSQIRFSPSITNQSCQNDEQTQSAELCIIGSQSCMDRNVVEAHRLSREMGVDTHSERITSSGSCAEVPVSVKNSSTLGCSSENYKGNTSSQDSRMKRTESMPILGFEYADNSCKKSPKSAGPSAVCSQSLQDRRVQDADFLDENKERNVYSGEGTRSGVSSKQQICDSTNADRSSDDYQGIGVVTMDSGDQPPNCVDGSPMKANLSSYHNEGCDTRESNLEDFGRHKESGTFSSLGSIQTNACIYETSNPQVSSVSAKVHGGILTLPSAGSARQVIDSQELSGLVKSSLGSIHRLTRSQTPFFDKETYHPVTDNESPSLQGAKSILDCEEKYADKLQITSSCQSVPPCPKTRNMLHEGCDDREPAFEDLGRHNKRDTLPSSSSIQRNCIDDIFNLEESSVSVKACGGITTVSTAGSPSVGLFHRLTRSQTRPYDKETHHSVIDYDNPSLEGTNSISDCEEKSSEELQTTSSGQSSPLCLGTHTMLHDDKNEKLVMSRELILVDHVDLSCLSSSNYSRQSKGLESAVAASVEPMQFKFIESDQYKSKAFTPRNRSHDNLPRKMSHSLHASDVSPVKEICGGNNQPSSSNQLLRMPDVSSEEYKAHTDSYETDVQESPDGHAENLGPIVGSPVLNDFKDNKEAEQNCRSSEVQDKAENNQPSSSNQLLRTSDISSEEDKAHRDSYEPDVQESPDSHAENLGPIVGSPLLKDFKDNTEVELNFRSSAVQDEAENNQPSSSNQLLRMSDISSEEDKVHGDSYEPDVQESTDSHAENLGPIVGSPVLKDTKDNTEAEPNCRSSEVQDKAESLLSKMVDITNIRIPPVKLHVKHELESSPVQCKEQGDCNDEGRDEGKLAFSVSERKSSRIAYVQGSAEYPVVQSYGCLIKKSGINPIAINEIKQYTAKQSQMLSWPEGQVIGEQGDSSLGAKFLGRPSTVRLQDKNSSVERIFTCARTESWPQAKRRKIGLQQAHNFTTSLMEHVNVCMNDGICLEVNTDQMEEQSAISTEHREVGSCHIKKNDLKDTSPVTNNKQLVAGISDLAMRESRNSQRCFIKGTRTSPISCYVDARTSGNKQCSRNLCNPENDADNLNSENLDLSSTLLKELQLYPKCEDGLYIQHSVPSSSNEDLQRTDIDSSMPVFEGFTVNAPTDTGELEFAADEFDLGELELPRMTLERASSLAEICRSTSFLRPSPLFSSAYKFQETWNLCKSVPDDGHLEHMEFENIYPLNPDVGIHFQSQSSSSDGLDQMAYSVPLAYSGERYGWNSRYQPLSPVGKLWNQHSSHTGSSGKCSSSNPELTCFPIEEDPSSSEDNKITEENAGDTQDETQSSFANYSDKRQPLKDLTNMGKNPPISVSAGEQTLRADSADFLSSKLSVVETLDKAVLASKYQCRKRSETSEMKTSSTGAADGRKHQLSSIGPNTTKKPKQSVNSTRKSIRKKISKPVVPNKTNLKEQDQDLSLKEARRYNIVSNVSSFIPLVQQKQAAAECTGKREVKVKALKAAEAARRLEERKENERKMRKEAIKLERAKLEEKNLRDIELEKKKKDEERKKKDADIIAKKRLREEEERKEKEKKRMRVEARHRQREKEEKKRTERPEKENQRTKDAQTNSKKEFNNESKGQLNKGTTKGEGMTLQKTESNLIRNELVDYKECGASGLSGEAGEVMDAVDKSPSKEDLLVQNSKGKSYEISPYQCSEDEDEDDELPAKKYIPSWASKCSISLFLPLQQELDPDVIFPRDRFCSMDEVLLPRKQQKTGATHEPNC